MFLIISSKNNPDYFDAIVWISFPFSLIGVILSNLAETTPQFEFIIRWSILTTGGIAEYFLLGYLVDLLINRHRKNLSKNDL